MKRHLNLKRRPGENGEPVNPMEGVANLADVMLVLAVGIMLALIINWNVDFPEPAELSTPTEKSNGATQLDADDITPAGEGDAPLDGNLKKLGAVYYDEKTGTYYLIESAEDE